MNSPLSLSEIKELIAYSRSQGVAALELGGLRYQFFPGSWDPPVPKEAPQAEPTDKSPFGHYVPE